MIKLDISRGNGELVFIKIGLIEGVMVLQVVGWLTRDMTRVKTPGQQLS